MARGAVTFCRAREIVGVNAPLVALSTGHDRCDVLAQIHHVTEVRPVDQEPAPGERSGGFAGLTAQGDGGNDCVRDLVCRRTRRQHRRTLSAGPRDPARRAHRYLL